MEQPRVIALVGPTCTGKTALSLDLADSFPAEIIACDSRTVYRHFDIGTAKPTAQEQARCKHHLIDVAEPEEEFTVTQFVDTAKSVIDTVDAAQKVPIVCGGTGFYFRALLEGLRIPDVPPQNELRQELLTLALNDGNPALKNKLEELDPAAALKINVNDRFRLIRALEVCLVTGQPFSSLAGRQELFCQTLWLGLTFRDRDLHRKIMRQRIEKQMADGMLEEARRLYDRYGPSQRLLNTVNYRDMVDHIEGRLNLADCIDSCEHNNYRLARRQQTWFNANPLIHWFYLDEMSPTEIRQSVLKLCQSFLRGLP